MSDADDDLQNYIHREIERAMAGRHNKKYGLVTSYDPNKYRAKVTLQPEGQETGWVPIHTGQVGNGWGMAAGLSIGDQVSLHPQEGDNNSLAITGVVHSDGVPPPTAQSGELVFQSKMGGFVKLLQDGSAHIADGGGASLTMDGSGNATLNATNIKLTGSVSIN